MPITWGRHKRMISKMTRKDTKEWPAKWSAKKQKYVSNKKRANRNNKQINNLEALIKFEDEIINFFSILYTVGIFISNSILNIFVQANIWMLNL